LDSPHSDAISATNVESRLRPTPQNESVTATPSDAGSGIPTTTDGHVRRPRRIGIALIVGVTLALAGLGIANIVTRATWRDVEDGALWANRQRGLTAVEVAPGGPASQAGITRGDILLSADGATVRTADDAVAAIADKAPGTPIRYAIARGDANYTTVVTLAAVASSSPLYFVLASVGLFTLFIGAVVRVRRPSDDATLHFFWLSVAFFGWFTFSFNGRLDRLDRVFYWGDVVATALLPPLLLHFASRFPKRPPAPSRRSAAFALLYAAGVALILARVGVEAAAGRRVIGGAAFASGIDILDRTELVFLSLCALGTSAVLTRASQTVTSLTGRRQLRWIAWGAALGVGPFALGYALPWALGANPPLALQLTAIPLGLVPLAFASAIVRYRLRDVEVIVKRMIGYSAFLAASAALYLALRNLAAFAFGGDDPHNWIVALLATIIVVLMAQPVKQAVQSGIDRIFYRDRYNYRRALVAFARDLNSDLDVVRLSQRLVARIVETLVVDRMALMLVDERTGDFEPIGDYGFPDAVPALRRASSLLPRLDAGRIVALDGSDPMAVARFAAEEVEFWRDLEVTYFVPCLFEGAAIAVLALGRADRSRPFNSEDLELLTAVAAQVATAIENGRLYRQLHLKAEELGRMRAFNENILESLEDGLVVFDDDERVVRWNHALERVYGLSRDEAIGHALSDVFDVVFVDALRAALRENPAGALLYKVPLMPRFSAAIGTRSEMRGLMVNVTAVPLRTPVDGDETTGTILLIEDVTDRVRLEEQLQISEKMASIGLLAAGVAHEVNTPLTGISSFTQMLLEGADPDDPRTLLLEKIEKQTFRAAKIVNGLLALSRPGSVVHERAAVDLNVVITDVLSLLEHQFEVARIKVRRELSPTPVVASGTEHQLQQVFLNLFLNARDAMPRGGWLSIATRSDGDVQVAEVADTGSGIPPEHLARIYDPFFTTKSIGRGTGLGLSISYGIVREHGGSLRCDSGVGQGTRFTLTLPVMPQVVRSLAQ
jgi:two-component system NtrC family sensor kinase